MKTLAILMATAVSAAAADQRGYRFTDRGGNNTTLKIITEQGKQTKYLFSERDEEPTVLVEADPKVTAHSLFPKNLFNGKEWQLSTYLASDMAGITDGTSIGTGVGVDYFWTRAFGTGLRAEFDDVNNTFIEDTLGRLTIRAPLWDAIAPYGFIEGGYNWEDSNWKAGIGLGGVYRFKNGVGVFVEGGLRLTAGRAEDRRSVTDLGSEIVIVTKDGSVDGSFTFNAGLSYSF